MSPAGQSAHDRGDCQSRKGDCLLFILFSAVIMYLFSFAQAGMCVCTQDMHRFLRGMKIHTAAMEGYYCHLLSHQRRSLLSFLQGVPMQTCKSVTRELLTEMLILTETKIELERSEQHHSKSSGQYIHFQSVTDRNTLFT